MVLALDERSNVPFGRAQTRPALAIQRDVVQVDIACGVAELRDVKLIVTVRGALAKRVAHFDAVILS